MQRIPNITMKISVEDNNFEADVCLETKTSDTIMPVVIKSRINIKVYQKRHPTFEYKTVNLGFSEAGIFVMYFKLDC